MARSKKLPESLADVAHTFDSTPELSVVKPLVQVAGEKHLLDQMLEDGEAPEMKAVGYMRMGKGPNAWVSYTVKFKGTEVTSIEIDEPNLRAIAEESAKIAFVNEFIDAEVG